ncbi:TetR/AcrR family transcriptional regulator [Psychrobacillus vulpis]|uniref:TetR/AcrR family transcriptional regulator n=1 Tax=Psychrobacillus vulpis TaxID=2325572 RepID=A0A544TVE5_9BACI|nr:TetR/AcrR family transcriptional regulator [Psychrobacillus vulpis]TQR21419.1 TetR/AcrR family transcriptional regulator [Psychrobacillus vulpis]
MEQLTLRQRQAKETKKKIQETALELFSKKGFDRVTVDEIVKKSGMSKGSFYVHFPSKYDVFLEKFKEIDDFYADFFENLPISLSFQEKILRLIESQMIYLRDELGKDLMRTVYMSGLTQTENNFFTNTDRKLYKIINSIVLKAQKNGEITNELTSNEVTMLITRCMRGTLYDWQLFEEGYDLIEESRKFTKAILGGIKV